MTVPMKLLNGELVPFSEGDLTQWNIDQVSNSSAMPQPAPPPVPDDVAVWQFMTAAWRLNFITQHEALAAIKDKVMPPAFADALGGLPPEAQVEAQLKFSGITRMVRSDPLFALLVAADKATDAQIDEVFSVAASII